MSIFLFFQTIYSGYWLALYIYDGRNRTDDRNADCATATEHTYSYSLFQSFLKKLGHYRPLFLYFRLFNTVDS